MQVRLQRLLWAGRLLAVALGLLLVAGMLRLNQAGTPVGLLSLSEAVEPPPGAEREGRPSWREERRRPNLVPDDEGVLEDDRAREEHAGQQEAAYSLARIARLLGWGAGQDHGDDVEEEHEGDRIRLKDWRSFEELGALQGRVYGVHDAHGPTTEWTDNALLRAFIARFGSVRTTGSPLPPADLEMTDLPSASPAASSSSPTAVSEAPSSTTTARVETTTYLLLPFCPLNGIITSQSDMVDGGGVANAVLEYAAAWLVSRAVGAGWRSALVPQVVLRQLSPVFRHLSLSALEQLPPTCRPSARALEDTAAALGSADLADLQALPARFLDPEAPLVIRRGALLPALLATHLSPLRDELSLKAEVRLAARSVLDICRQRLPSLQGRVQDGSPRDDTQEDQRDGDERVAFVALHVRRRGAAAPWWVQDGRPRRVLGADYFLAAISHFRSRLQRRGLTPVFVVATDDPGWVHDNLRSEADVCVTGTGGGVDEYVDFAVQASCHHAVLDLSSAAVATALFVEGEVVYPRVTSGPRPDLDKMPGWVAM